jgi:hypothetical protein
LLDNLIIPTQHLSQRYLLSKPFVYNAAFKIKASKCHKFAAHPKKARKPALKTISKAKKLQDYLPGTRPVSFPTPPVFERTNSPFVNRCIHKHPKQLTIGEFSLYPISDESSVPQLNSRIISQSKTHCKQKILLFEKKSQNAQQTTFIAQKGRF